MIRVLQITKNLGLGGRERIVAELGRGLIDEGFLSSICCLDRSGEWAGFLPEAVHVIELNKAAGVDWRAIVRIRNYILGKHIELVHAHNPGTLMYGALAAALSSKIILISTEHGFSSRIGMKGKIKQRLLYGLVNEVCAVSQKLAVDIGPGYGLTHRHIHVVRNGVSSAAVSESPTSSKHRIGFNPEEFNVGIVARLVPVKNHRMLLRAFSAASKRAGNLKLWIIGSGELRDNLEKCARELGIRDSVIFLGNRTDVPAILNALDVFVLCSYSEGMSVTLLEAMSAGLPIVATGVGGNCEAIVHLQSGFLVESDNHQQLADAIVTLHGNRTLAAELGRNAQMRFEERFSVQRMVSETAAVYRSALSNKRRGYKAGHVMRHRSC